MSASSAVDGEHPFSVITLNVNKLSNDLNSTDKTTAIARIIKNARPHVVALTETGQPRRTELPPLQIGATYKVSDHYDVYTSTASDSNKSTGVALYVDKGIHAVKVAIKERPDTAGRICAVDLALPDEQKRRKSLRVVGIYSPTGQQGAKADTSSKLNGFWAGVTEVIQSAKGDWIIAGDYNAHVNPAESFTKSITKGYERVRQRQQAYYRSLLNAVLGKDTWEAQGGATWEQSWSMYAWSSVSTRRVIDRFTVSAGLSPVRTETLYGDGSPGRPLVPSALPSLVDARNADLDAPPVLPVPGTNHRPVRLKIRLGCLLPNKGAKSASPVPPRPRQPHRQHAEAAFGKLNDSLRSAIATTPPPTLAPTTPQQCDDLYDWVISVFVSACESSFSSRKIPDADGDLQPATTAALEAAKFKDLQLGRAARAIKENRFPALFKRDKHVREAVGTFTDESFGPHYDNDEASKILKKIRGKHSNVLRREQRRVDAMRPRAAEQAEWDKAIRGGRIKHLFEPRLTTSPPFLLKAGSGGGDATLETGSEAKLAVWTRHFKTLLRRAPVPQLPKPWLATSQPLTPQSPDKGGEAFSWPRQVSVPELRRLLRKGNRRPSPGPDGMEKWALAGTCDEFLSIIAAIVNFVIAQSYFPSALKSCYMTPVYKRGDSTDPNNYRGIAHSNVLYQLISSFFGSELRRFSCDKGLISPTQVAGQAGVQPGDLVGFLQQLDVVASINNQTLFVIKRDQKQGFDRLDPSAFEDALRYWGFNQSVIDFERARLGVAAVRVKSPDGIASETFVTQGPTRQGDASSNFRFIFADSLLYWYWRRDDSFSPLFPRLRTRNGGLGKPHTEWEKLTVVIPRILGATDDSLIVGRDWASLKKLVVSAEEFQAAYGMVTNWDHPDKTSCFILGDEPRNMPNSIVISLSGNRLVTVPVSKEPTFLQTAFKNPAKQLDRVLDVMERFPLPAQRKLPLSLIRRAVTALLLPKIRGVLSLQPLPLSMALELDSALVRKVSEALGVAYRDSPVMMLPIDQLGFGLPSLFRLNGELAIGGLLRSLNSPLPPFRCLASMTWLNWSCRGYMCANPFRLGAQDDTRLQLPQSAPPSLDINKGKQQRNSWQSEPRLVPQSWTAAQNYGALGDLVVVEPVLPLRTARPLHVLNVARVSDTPPPTPFVMDALLPSTEGWRDRTFQDWKSIILRKLSDSEDNEHDDGQGTDDDIPSDWPRVTFKNEDVAAFAEWAESFDFDDLAYPDTTAMCTVQEMKEQYRSTVLAAFRPSRSVDYNPDRYATDGSSLRLDHGKASTTAAVTGAVRISLKLSDDQYTSAADGEALAIVAAIYHARMADRGEREIEIISDSRNSLRAIAEHMAVGPKPSGQVMKPRPAAEVYRWLFEEVDLARKSGISLRLSHIEAHTNSDSIEALWNEEADLAAAAAHERGTRLPPLSGWMPSWTVWSDTLGFINNHWKQELDRRLIGYQWLWLGVKDKRVIPRNVLGRDKIPGYFYKRDPKGFVAKVQLMTRLRIFPNNHRRHLWGGGSAACGFCEEADQTDEHLFAWCPHFTAAKEDAIFAAVEIEAKRLAGPPVSANIQPGHADMHLATPASALPSDDDHERQPSHPQPHPQVPAMLQTELDSTERSEDTAAVTKTNLDTPGPLDPEQHLGRTSSNTEEVVMEIPEVLTLGQRVETLLANVNHDERQALAEYWRYLRSMFDPTVGCNWWQGHCLPRDSFSISSYQFQSAHNCAAKAASHIAAVFFAARAAERAAGGQST